MEAEAVDELPSGGGWQYEPKYDGFRCLAHRRGERVHLQSRNQKPLERYFPEVARGLGDIAEDSFVLDGELVLPGGSFETLQLRLHPAESRIRLLSKRPPRSSLSSTSWLAREHRCSNAHSRIGVASLKRS